MVLLIQVPLKHRSFMRASGALPAAAAELKCARQRDTVGDVENAVIGHGRVEGPYTEIDGLPIERDERFPVRVTIQFYKATSNGVVTEKDLASIADQISKVYANADYAGSLVTSGSTDRPTEYDGRKNEPADWWERFWDSYEKSHDQSREEAIRMLRRTLGPKWRPRSEQELVRRLAEARKNK